MNPSLVVLANLSNAAEHAARYAAAFGAPLHVHLALLHFYHDPVLLAPELAIVPAAQVDRNYAATAAGIQALARQLPGGAEAVVSMQAMSDAVAEAIGRFHPLVLAMGLSTEHDLLDYLLHNRALPVLRATHHPLLLVPETSTLLRPPRRVLLALDAEPFTLNPAARLLAPLLAAWRATHTVAHLPTHHEYLSSPGQMALANARASGLLPPNTPLHLHEQPHETAAAGVLHAIASTEADLLMLVARPRSFMGRLFHNSVTAQVLRHSPIPILLVPTEAPELPGWMPTMG